jgi:hypothetical protein
MVRDIGEGPYWVIRSKKNTFKTFIKYIAAVALCDPTLITPRFWLPIDLIDMERCEAYNMQRDRDGKQQAVNNPPPPPTKGWGGGMAFQLALYIICSSNRMKRFRSIGDITLAIILSMGRDWHVMNTNPIHSLAMPIYEKEAPTV